MKIIPIETLSTEHEGLRVSFDCPSEISWSKDGGAVDGTGRPVNTELEWRYQGRNDLNSEPGVGIFRHVHSGLWIKIHLNNPLVMNHRIWIEESPTEKLIGEVTKYLESRADTRGRIEVRITDATGTWHFFREEDR